MGNLLSKQAGDSGFSSGNCFLSAYAGASSPARASCQLQVLCGQKGMVPVSGIISPVKNISKTATPHLVSDLFFALVHAYTPPPPAPG